MRTCRSARWEYFSERNEPIEFATFTVNVARDTQGAEDVEDTKSTISIDSELFKNAVLWAFYTDGGVSKCLSTTTTESTFSWSLPLKTAMKIYCIVNYGGLNLDSYLNKEDLTESTLNDLMYSCSSFSTFVHDGETYGLPKAGITTVSNNQLLTGNESLSISVKNLYAKFNVKFDLSEVSSDYDIVFVGATVFNMNQSVNYFQTPGYKNKNEVAGITQRYDRAPSGDLDILALENEVTFYVLENMQGTIGSTCKWYEVGSKAAAVSKCTFLSVQFSLQDKKTSLKQDRWLDFYLTTTDDAMQYGNVFDIERNKISSLTYKIPKDVIKTDPVPYFEFLDKVKDIPSGSSITIDYNTNCSTKEFTFNSSGLTYVDNGSSVTVTCPSGIISGEYTLSGKGIKDEKSASDQVKIVVKEPEISLTSISVQQNNLSVVEGEDVSFSIYATFSDGVTVDCKNMTAAQRAKYGTPTISYENNGPTYFSVNDYLVTGLRKGVSDFEVTVSFGTIGNDTESVDVTVIERKFVLKIDKNTFDSEGGNMTVTIETNTTANWYLTNDDDYLWSGNKTGSGNSSFVVTVPKVDSGNGTFTYGIYGRLVGKAGLSDLNRTVTYTQTVSTGYTQVDVWMICEYTRYMGSYQYVAYARSSEDVIADITVTDNLGNEFVIEDGNNESEYMALGSILPSGFSLNTVVYYSVSCSPEYVTQGGVRHHYVPDH